MSSFSLGPSLDTLNCSTPEEDMGRFSFSFLLDLPLSGEGGLELSWHCISLGISIVTLCRRPGRRPEWIGVLTLPRRTDLGESPATNGTNSPTLAAEGGVRVGLPTVQGDEGSSGERMPTGLARAEGSFPESRELRLSFSCAFELSSLFTFPNGEGLAVAGQSKWTVPKAPARGVSSPGRLEVIRALSPSSPNLEAIVNV